MTYRDSAACSLSKILKYNHTQCHFRYLLPCQAWGHFNEVIRLCKGECSASLLFCFIMGLFVFQTKRSSMMIMLLLMIIMTTMSILYHLTYSPLNNQYIIIFDQSWRASSFTFRCDRSHSKGESLQSTSCKVFWWSLLKELAYSNGRSKIFNGFRRIFIGYESRAVRFSRMEI